VDLKTIAKLCRGDYLSAKVETLCRVAGTLGVAPAELVSALAGRPRSGLVWARAVSHRLARMTQSPTKSRSDVRTANATLSQRDLATGLSLVNIQNPVYAALLNARE